MLTRFYRPDQIRLTDRALHCFACKLWMPIVPSRSCALMSPDAETTNNAYNAAGYRPERHEIFNANYASDAIAPDIAPLLHSFTLSWSHVSYTREASAFNVR